MAKILLVDDDQQLLQVAAALLTHAEHVVSCCENVVDALDLARRETFDVVITDANMTPHSGFEFIRSLKLLNGYSLTPVAMLTGRREKRDVERALAVGAKDYIVKPLDPDLFLRKVGELASQSEADRRVSRFAELPCEEFATCRVPLLVIGLSEAGVLLDSDHAIHIGSTVTVETELFQRIGLGPVQVRVTSSTPGLVENTYEIRTVFENLDEKNLVKLRHYIHSQTQQQLKRTSRAS